MDLGSHTSRPSTNVLTAVVDVCEKHHQLFSVPLNVYLTSMISPSMIVMAVLLLPLDSIASVAAFKR